MFKVRCDWQVEQSEKDLMQSFMNKCSVIEEDNSMQTLIIEENRTGLLLGDKTFWCDFNDSWHQNILKTLNIKNSNLARALNLPKNKNILDATAGFGRDAFCIALLGANVLALEQHPLIALMLMWSAKKINNLNVKYQNHNQELGLKVWDVIYFDYVFEKTKRKSKAKQNIELISQLSQNNLISENLWQLALKSCKRIVVKRPTKETNINFLKNIKPNHSIKNKTTCFDIYLGEKT